MWTRGKHAGSLSSGEGLIYAVRDEEYGFNGKGEEILKDEGVKDKRLFLVQAEFGSMLRVMGREGNSLSGHLRDAWDGETLKPMTKGYRIQATYPHIVVVGHVTQPELLRNLNNTEMANGFGNRFCWFVVRRSKFLPFANDPEWSKIAVSIEKLQAALGTAKEVQEIGMEEKARVWWMEAYSELSQGTPGLAGALLDRGEAQVTRLAALYALLDSQKLVGVHHLYAALALWNYSVASVKYLYGTSLGDPIADTMFNALLQPGPLSDTNISALFGGNVPASHLTQSKQLLRELGKIQGRAEPTEKRSKKVWEVVRN